MTSMPCWRASRGLWIVTGWPLMRISPESAGWAPDERVHQRRLPGAVAAHEADDLTGVEVDADVLDGMDATEGHADVAELDQRWLLGCGRGFGAGRKVGHG